MRTQSRVRSKSWLPPTSPIPLSSLNCSGGDDAPFPHTKPGASAGASAVGDGSCGDVSKAAPPFPLAEPRSGPGPGSGGYPHCHGYPVHEQELARPSITSLHSQATPFASPSVAPHHPLPEALPTLSPSQQPPLLETRWGATSRRPTHRSAVQSAAAGRY